MDNFVKGNKYAMKVKPIDEKTRNDFINEQSQLMQEFMEEDLIEN